MTTPAWRVTADRGPGYARRKRRSDLASRALLSFTKLVYGRGVSESLYPLSLVTAPKTPPMPMAEPSDLAVEVRRAKKEPQPDPANAAPAAPSRRADRSRGFVVEVEGVGELGCTDVRGFREGALAAVDPRAAAPSRLLLVGPEADLDAWLLSFAEDTEQVRRTLTIIRRFDGKAIRAVVTISAYGYGVETSLAVESVAAPRSEGDDEEIFRSGVHLKADIAAALARYAEEGPLSSDMGAWASELGLGDFR